MVDIGGNTDGVHGHAHLDSSASECDVGESYSEKQDIPLTTDRRSNGCDDMVSLDPGDVACTDVTSHSSATAGDAATKPAKSQVSLYAIFQPCQTSIDPLESCCTIMCAFASEQDKLM